MWLASVADLLRREAKSKSQKSNWLRLSDELPIFFRILFPAIGFLQAERWLKVFYRAWCAIHKAEVLWTSWRLPAFRLVVRQLLAGYQQEALGRNSQMPEI